MPRFVQSAVRTNPPASGRSGAAIAGISLALLLALGGSRGAAAQETLLPDGPELARRINARDDGTVFRADLSMELTDRRQTRRMREIRSIRRDVGEARQELYVFDSPNDVRGTGLLVHDHREPGQPDDQWLYIPAARKVRRLATGDRGGYFAGSDFTYEDMKNGTKVTLDDYRWQTLRQEPMDGADCYVLEGLAVSPDVAEQIGHGRIAFWVDAKTAIPRRSERWDTRGILLKTVENRDLRQVDGIWTAFTIEATQHQTEHRTTITVNNARYDFPSTDALFADGNLQRALALLVDAPPDSAE